MKKPFTILAIVICVICVVGVVGISTHRRAIPLAHVDADSIHIDTHTPSAGPAGLGHD